MIDIENYIIGSILMDNSSLGKVYDILSPYMFEDQICKDAYSISLALYDNNERIDIANLSQRLETNERSREEVDKRLYDIARSASDEFVSSYNITAYADTIVKDWKSRQVTKLLSRVDTMPASINDTILELITELESLQTSEKATLKKLSKIVEENKDNYFTDNSSNKGIKTGFYKVDELLISLEKSSFTIIAARPAVGKTVFALQIAKKQAEAGKKVAIFSLEMGDKELYERLLVSDSDIELTRLKKANKYLGNEKEQFDNANEHLNTYPLYIATGDFSVNKIYRMCKHQNLDLIIIDYIQLLDPDTSYKGNRASEVGEISRNLKKMAMKLNVPVVALSQLNRMVESKKDKEPNMSELRESGSLEQDANNIIMLWNLNDKKGCPYKGVKVDKCRQGETGKVGMIFDGSHMTFTERYEDFHIFEKRAKEETEFVDATELFDDFI